MWAMARTDLRDGAMTDDVSDIYGLYEWRESKEAREDVIAWRATGVLSAEVYCGMRFSHTGMRSFHAGRMCVGRGGPPCPRAEAWFFHE